MGASGVAGISTVSAVSPHITAHSWGAVPASWSKDPRWLGEWMTLAGEQWFARIAPGTDPSLPPVVMVHGIIVSGKYFRPIANIMDPRYTIYVPDLPGIGRPVSKQRWTIPLWTEHLAGWMDAHGLSGAVVVSNSFGCQVSTLLAATRPDLVRAQVLIAPTRDPAIRSIPEVIWHSARAFPKERLSVWPIWIPDFFKTGPLRSFRMIQEMFRDHQLTRLADVAQPSLVVGGERDPISPPAWIHRMASSMPRGAAIIVPGAFHALNYSRPHDLVDAIARAVIGGRKDALR
jgi:2-hydroxy-6-oxonona-2,4-dienedioate hydrolase